MELKNDFTDILKKLGRLPKGQLIEHVAEIQEFKESIHNLKEKNEALKGEVGRLRGKGIKLIEYEEHTDSVEEKELY